MTRAADLAHVPADGTLVLEPLGERHRAELKVACAEDRDIWPIYSVSFDPDHFDAAFDRLIGEKALLPFAVIDDRVLAGMSAYIKPNPARGVVAIGYSYLRPAMRGTGLNARLKRLMLGHAFACGYRRVEFHVDMRNARSQAAMAKLGATREGILRADRITWTGHVRDTALFSILASEWPFTAG